MDERKPVEDEIDLEEMLGWGEFCAWSALVMTPIIWWLQGASVSMDQFVVRTVLVVISALAGIGLRMRAVIVRRREAKVRDAGGGGRQSSTGPAPPP